MVSLIRVQRGATEAYRNVREGQTWRANAIVNTRPPKSDAHDSPWLESLSSSSISVVLLSRSPSQAPGAIRSSDDIGPTQRRAMLPRACSISKVAAIALGPAQTRPGITPVAAPGIRL